MAVMRYTFAGGEIDSRVALRGDLQRYYNSCIELKNFVVTPIGGVIRRPGTKYDADFHIGAGTSVKLIPFVYSQDQQYLLVIYWLENPLTWSSETVGCKLHIRRINSDGSTSQVVYMLDLPYEESEISELRWCQSADVLWLAHPNHPIQRIERHADDDWRVTEHACLGGPWLPRNQDRERRLFLEPVYWDASTNYEQGDMVAYRLPSVNVTAGEWVYYTKTYSRSIIVDNEYDPLFPPSEGSPKPMSWHNLDEKYGKFWAACLTVSSASGFEVGDTVLLQGIHAQADGLYEVINVDAGSNKVTINMFVTDQYTWFPASFTSATLQKIDPIYYECLVANSGQDPTTTTGYWRELSAYTGNVTIKSSFDLFDDSWVGGLLDIETEPDKSVISDIFSVPGQTSHPVPIYGSVQFTTTGRWEGTIELQMSQDNGATWTTIATVSSVDANNNETLVRDIDEPGTLVRVQCTDYNGAISKPTGIQWTLTPRNYYISTIVKITNITDARTVSGMTVTPLWKLASTHRWREGAFRPGNGYPSCITIWQGRLVLAGTPRQPDTVWFSKIQDYNAFYDGRNPDDAITLTLGGEDVQRIQWIAATRHLVVGTDAAEWSIGPRNDTSGFTPDNYKIIKHTRHGSAPVAAVTAADGIVFLARGRSAPYYLSYDWPSDTFQAMDLTLLSSHIWAESRIKELIAARRPWQHIFVTRDDGDIYVLTMVPSQKVFGWAHWDFPNGDVVAVAAMSGEYSDRLYLAINRPGELIQLEILELISSYQDADIVEQEMNYKTCLDWYHEVQPITYPYVANVGHNDFDAEIVWTDGEKELSPVRGWVDMYFVPPPATGKLDIFLKEPYPSKLLIETDYAGWLNDGVDYVYDYHNGVIHIYNIPTTEYQVSFTVYGVTDYDHTEDGEGNALQPNGSSIELNGYTFEEDPGAATLGYGVRVESTIMPTAFLALPEVDHSGKKQITSPVIVGSLFDYGGSWSTDGGASWAEIDYPPGDIEQITWHNKHYASGVLTLRGKPGRLTNIPRVKLKWDSPWYIELVAVGVYLKKGAQ